MEKFADFGWKLVKIDRKKVEILPIFGISSEFYLRLEKFDIGKL